MVLPNYNNVKFLIIPLIFRAKLSIFRVILFEIFSKRQSQSEEERKEDGGKEK